MEKTYKHININCQELIIIIIIIFSTTHRNENTPFLERLLRRKNNRLNFRAFNRKECGQWTSSGGIRLTRFFSFELLEMGVLFRIYIVKWKGRKYSHAKVKSNRSAYFVVLLFYSQQHCITFFLKSACEIVKEKEDSDRQLLLGSIVLYVLPANNWVHCTVIEKGRKLKNTRRTTIILNYIYITFTKQCSDIPPSSFLGLQKNENGCKGYIQYGSRSRATQHKYICFPWTL